MIFVNSALEAIHSAASGLFTIDAIPQETMGSFDAACLEDLPELHPAETKEIRENLNVNQPVFARYQNTNVSTVQKWETGAKRPGGMSLRLLSIVRKHGLEVLF
ncbi:helix-turn-helix domain-containing protein [Erwinia sp.]|uniref:helix-turn-helix domain-containing protein n=1 Tax=Erwinia citreus TaxID=558 RepID=UPI003C78290E